MKQYNYNQPRIIYRQDQPKTNGECVFYIQIHIQGKKVSLSTKISCLPTMFDVKTNKVSRKVSDYIYKNSIIDNYYNKANEIILKAVSNKQDITTKEFKEQFYDKPKKTDKLTFYEFVLNEIELQVKKSEFAPGTIKKNKDQLNKLNRYRQGLLINDINETFLANYSEFMLQTLKNGNGGYTNSLKFIRKFYNIALAKGLVSANPFATFKIKVARIENKSRLGQEQLSQLENYYNTLKKTHKHYLTLKSFLFGCYTGLRHSDIEKFCLKNIVQTTVNNTQATYIEIVARKSNKLSQIPLPSNGKAYNLINFDLQSEIPNLKTPCNQTCNRNLKEIAQYLNIIAKITMHSSRHTFATLMLNKGVRRELVQSILGHTTSKQTDVYAKLNINTVFNDIVNNASFLT